MRWNPYLTFDGTCETAFNFYAKCLGGKIVMLSRFGDLPPDSGMQIPAEHGKKIMHARLIAGSQVLMGSDHHPGRPYEGVKGCSVAIMADTPDEAERVFNALAEKGMVVMPLTQTFWAVRFGMLVDQFGVPWMVNCEQAR